MTDRRWHLRTATAPAHDALENLVGTLSDLDRYRRYVTGLHCFRASIEPVIRTASCREGFGADALAIEGELAKDMADLGCSPLPTVPADSMVTKREDLMGALYVLEGSSLGARVLIGEARKLGLDDQHGARHLAAQCATPNTWRRFIEQLETMEPLDMQRLTDAAAATFELARLAFERVDNAAKV